LIGAVRRSGVKRYLVVGGAGSLEVSPGLALVDSPGFPALYRDESLAGKAFLDALRKVEDLDWTMLSPSALLGVTQVTERRLGRVTTFRWGPRVIDIDILLFADTIMEAKDLTIPHPAMHQRRFVLEPLAEIAPQALHPVLKKTIRELLDLLPEGQSVRRVPHSSTSLD